MVASSLIKQCAGPRVCVSAGTKCGRWVQVVLCIIVRRTCLDASLEGWDSVLATNYLCIRVFFLCTFARWAKAVVFPLEASDGVKRSTFTSWHTNIRHNCVHYIGGRVVKHKEKEGLRVLTRIRHAHSRTRLQTHSFHTMCCSKIENNNACQINSTNLGKHNIK